MANNQFLHEEVYRGAKAVAALKTKHVLLCGCGAVGSNLADILARCGVGKLTLVDFDRVEEHNLGTQLFTRREIGMLKTQGLESHLFAAAPGCQVDQCTRKVTDLKIMCKLLRGKDLVVDVFDNAVSRKLVQAACAVIPSPCLHVGMAADYFEVIWSDRYKVPEAMGPDVCEYPLARTNVLLAVTVAAEEILDHLTATQPRQASWSGTLKDLAIRRIAR